MVSRGVGFSVVFELSSDQKITQYCKSDNSLIKRTWKMTLKKLSGKSAKNNEKVLFKLYI